MTETLEEVEDSTQLIPDNLSLEVRSSEALVPDNCIREELSRLKAVIEASYFEVGKYLYRVLHRDLWKGWGFHSFQDYVEKEMQYRLRKAQYLVSIWKTLRVDCGVQEQDMQGIPWSKAKEIQRVANPGNVNEWLEKARTQSVHQLQHEVKEVLEPSLPPEEKEGTESNPKPVVVEQIKRFGVNLFEGQYEIVNRALEVARLRAHSDKTGHLLSLIATEFCTYNSPEDPDRAIEWYITMLEQTFGVKLVAFKDETVARRVMEILAAEGSQNTLGLE